MGVRLYGFMYVLMDGWIDGWLGGMKDYDDAKDDGNGDAENDDADDDDAEADADVADGVRIIIIINDTRELSPRSFKIVSDDPRSHAELETPSTGG